MPTAFLSGIEASVILATRLNEVVYGYGHGIKVTESIGSQVIRVSNEDPLAHVITSIHKRQTTSALLHSQILLYAIPYLYTIAGYRYPMVISVAAGNQHPSRFADFTNVMAVRDCGWILLSTSTVQEIYDFYLLGQITAYQSSVPLLLIFDDKRLSHEYTTVNMIDKEHLSYLFPKKLAEEFKERHVFPSLTSFNHSSNEEKSAKKDIFSLMQTTMDRLSALTGRQYFPMTYFGHPESKYVIIAMGAVSTLCEKVIRIILFNNPENKFGLLKISLYRPWSTEYLLKCLPSTVRRIAVLEAIDDSISTWSPLFLDVVSAYQSIQDDKVDIVTCNYNGDEEDICPATITAIYEELSSITLKQRFNIKDLNLGDKSAIGSQIESMFIEQVIFIGKELHARQYACNTERHTQLYSTMKKDTIISHVRVGNEEDLFIPSLIINAHAVIVYTELLSHTEYVDICIDTIALLHQNGLLIFDGCDASYLDTCIPPAIKNAIFIKGASLSTTEDLSSHIQRGKSILDLEKRYKAPDSWNTNVAKNADDLEKKKPNRKPKLLKEMPYFQSLYQTFGDEVCIVNAYNASSIWNTEDADLQVETASFGFGKLISRINNQNQFISWIKTIFPGTILPLHISEVICQWVLQITSANPQKQKVNSLAKTMIHFLQSLPRKDDHIKTILDNQDHLFLKSNWLIGSDHWAYDMAQSGLHHVITTGENINILVIDSTPYTDTSHLTQSKKDIGLYAMNHGSVYVASVAIYYSYTGVLNALIEADSYKGPSVILAYLPQSQGNFNPINSLKETKICVDNGTWPLYRWNPSLENEGKEMFTLDSPHIKRQLKDFLARQNNLSQIVSSELDLSNALSSSLESDVKKRHSELKRRAKLDYNRLLSGMGSSCGPPLTILFASDNGNGEAVAKRIAVQAKIKGIQVKLMSMDSYEDIRQLSNENNLVIVCSTAGQGEMPSNGREFWKALNQLAVGDASFVDLRVGIFGLGDSHYWPREEDIVFFNRPAKLLDAKFETLGSSKLVPLGLGDDQNDDGFETALGAWLPKLWRALNVDDTINEKEPIYTDDQMKIDSNYLRGTISQDLSDLSSGMVPEMSQKLLKFHGVYGQDDRDLRNERKRKGLEKASSFLIRVRTSGGYVSSSQWLDMDTLSEKYANKTLKLTTRQSFQMHGVLKKNLRTTIRRINKTLLTTLGACGDVNRNIIGSAMIDVPEIHDQIQSDIKKLTELLTPQTHAYYEIWLDNSMVAGHAVQDFEPIYGPSYLPRKFKIAFAVPPYNDVDVYAHDIGYIAIVDQDKRVVLGYNVLIGGGMGMTFGNKKTYPNLGTIIGYVSVESIVDITRAILLTQKDHGDRLDRKQARFKYTINRLGLPMIVDEIKSRCDIKLEKSKDFSFVDNFDRYGWRKGYNNTWDYTFFIENGRVRDSPDVHHKTGLRELARLHKGGFRLTSNQHLIVCGVEECNLEAVKEHLRNYKLDNQSFSALRKSSTACVALPTCSLAMAESERYLPQLITMIEDIMEDAGLDNDTIVIRMTGCPNGCARPYLAEIAFVGKAPDTYNMYMGGSIKGDRLNKIYRENLHEEEILMLLKPMIHKYATEKKKGEAFGDWVIREGYVKRTVAGVDFHA